MADKPHIVAEIGAGMALSIIHTASSQGEARKWAEDNLKVAYWEDDAAHPGCSDILTFDFRQYVLQAAS